jgi:anti-anti-sigma factor
MLAIQERHEGDVATIRPVGELDLSSAHGLEEAVNRLSSESCRQIILDLARVSSVDRAGVGAVTRAQAYCEAQGCGFWLMSARAPVRRVFDECGITG